MKNWKFTQKYITGLLGAVLVVMVMQYALLTGLVRPVHLVFLVMQIFCYLLLIVVILRGLIQRSRLAWLVAQIMLCALFDFSLLFTAVSAVFSLKTSSLWGMVVAAVITAVLNGLMMGVLFSIPVADYFRPLDEDQ